MTRRLNRLRRRTLTLAPALLALAWGVHANAGTAPRAWVSGHGVDQVGCGAPTDPCRSLQYVHDNIVGPGGEIDILDPAGYGAVHITKAISIVNDGVGTAGVQATSGDAITVDAGALGLIYLRGLNIDGVGFSGANGIVFNTGAKLFIANCVVRHFATNGVQIQPTSGTSAILVTGTTVANNALIGLHFAPPSGAATVSLAVANVTAAGNGQAGITIDNTAATGVADVAISDTDVFDNAQFGIVAAASAAGTTVSVDDSHVSLNPIFGLDRDGAASVHLSRSVFDQNGTGISNGSGSGAIFSTGDNRVAGNKTADVSGSLLPDALH